MEVLEPIMSHVLINSAHKRESLSFLKNGLNFGLLENIEMFIMRKLDIKLFGMEMVM